MSFFLRNAFGLFIQLYPCILLYFAPFPAESYRFSRRRVLSGMTLYALGAALVFPGILYLPEAAGGGHPTWFTYMMGNLLFLLAAVGAIAGGMWSMGEAAVKKWLVTITVTFYAAAQFWLVNLLMYIIPFGAEGYVYSLRGILMYVATAAVLVPVMMVVIRPMRVFIREIAPEDMVREFRIAAVTTVVYIGIMVYFSSISSSYSTADVLLYSPLFLALIFEQCLVYVVLFQETIRKKREGDIQRTVALQALQVEKIEREMENSIRMRHDMRHHVHTLQTLLEKGQTEEAQAYLTALGESTARSAGETYCRNFTVNALLQFYVGLARDEHIVCQVRADLGDLPVDPADLTTLLGNTFENAIHGCLQFTREEERWIQVQAGVVSGNLAIEVSNACQRVHLARRFEKTAVFLPAEAFLSERPGGGFALRSVSYTAEKYGGEARFSFDCGKRMFTTRIRMNLHPEML